MNTIIDTKYGKIQGTETKDAILFKGIPYAKPPVGPLRFMPPQETGGWEDILICDHWGNCPIQPPENVEDMLPDGTRPFRDYTEEQEEQFFSPMSEDCLYMNIWMPKEVHKHCPVVLYIFGGAFLCGNANKITFDGGAFARNGIICVSFNYRLGVFGYYANRLLKEEQGTTGNYGTLDQLAALKWVYENIGDFGGDAQNITVMGHSAGGMSVQALLCSPKSRGMIRHASMHSGGGYPFAMSRNLDTALAQGELLMNALHISTLKELRAVPAKHLFGVGMQIMMQWLQEHRTDVTDDVPLIYIPTIDGNIIPESFDACMENGNIENVDCIIGSTKNDVGVPDEVIENGSRHCNIYDICGGFSLMREKQAQRPTYVYYFMHSLPGDTAGAPHCCDANYIFDILHRSARPFTEEDEKLRDKMVDMWCNFARYGNPNGTQNQVWRPYTKADPFVMDFK